VKEVEDDLQIRQVQLLQPIQKKITEVVAELGKQDGFTLIFDRTAQGLVYAPDALDVTDLVIERLNKKK
jgi:outer membrane protein